VTRQEHEDPGRLAELPAADGGPSPNSGAAPPTTDGGRPARPPRRRLLGVTAGLLALAAAGAWALLAGRAGGEPTRADAPRATAAVERVTLVQTERHDGTLGYADQRTLAAGAAGTLTALRDEGATVERGQTLFRVDQRPLTLFYGTVPLYRTLGQGVSDGADVEQLEENLDALGHGADVTVDSAFTAATAEAVRDWQADRGLEQTGTVDAGQVVFLPGPVRVGEHKAPVGARVQPAAPVTAVSSTSRTATVELPAGDASVAGTGDPVDIELPGGRTAEGRITEVGTVAKTPATAEGTTDPGEPTITVTIRVARGGATGDLDQAPVRVTFVKERKRDVLAVPVTALLGLAEGGYAVEVAEGGATRLVEVETGLFASGRVEVAGAGVREGQRVVVPA
jgi:peptidoglycan hydrolase-like protein with peptidoglycan-binding domain